MLRLYERYKKDDPSAVFPFEVRRSLRLPDNGSVFYFIHGYQLDVLANLEPLDIESYENLSDHMCFIEAKMGGLASYIVSLFRNAVLSSPLYGLPQIYDLEQKLMDLTKAPHERPPEYIKNIEKLAESTGAYVLLGMKPDEKLVFGHTHNPCLNPPKKEKFCMDPDGTIANTGSWVNEKSKECQNTYVKISNGRMECKVFDEDDFP
jgi:hypothetical protein